MLEAREATYAYTRDRTAIEQVSVALEPGSLLGILGVNGSGKSTLLSCLDDLIRPKSGAVLLDGEPMPSVPRRNRARSIALVEQRSAPGALTVYDAVLLGRKPHLSGAPSRADHEAVERVLAELGLEPLALRNLDELSGGEHQKVLIARALAQDTPVLLLDEPTNNLDPANQQEVMRAVRRAVDERRIAAAAVLHDINLALRYCDRYLVLKDGRVRSLGGAETITEQTVRENFGLEADIIVHNGRNVVIPR